MSIRLLQYTLELFHNLLGDDFYSELSVRIFTHTTIRKITTRARTTITYTVKLLLVITLLI